MTYIYQLGVKKGNQHKGLLTVAALLILGAGGYILTNVMYPALPANIAGGSEHVTKVLKQRQPDLKENRLYVPKIGVDVSIVTGVTEKTLEGGAWHRVPDNGNPQRGGNFVLAAHRFNLGLTPQQTRARSPFYNINQLQAGDQVYVDFDGTRYAYEVTEKFKVGSNDTSIEKQTSTRLTLYSCDLRGPKAGREVVLAKPVGTVAWMADGPKLRANSN